MRVEDLLRRFKSESKMKVQSSKAKKKKKKSSKASNKHQVLSQQVLSRSSTNELNVVSPEAQYRSLHQPHVPRVFEQVSSSQTLKSMATQPNQELPMKKFFHNC